MKKNQIIIADQDSELYYSLVMYFIHKFSDEEIELQVITQLSVLKEIVAGGRKIDILIVNESFYHGMDKPSNIKQFIVLSEQYKNVENDNGRVTTVFRYVKLQTLEHVILAHMTGGDYKISRTKKKSSMILVTSVTGGTGKTVTALALAKELQKKGKKSLYINAEWIQDFDHYLQGVEVMSPETQKAFIFHDGKSCKEVLAEVKTSGDINYVPQIDTPIVSMNKSIHVYLNLIQQIMKEEKYQYVVVDTDHCLDQNKARLLTLCDRVIMVMDSSLQSAHKFSKLMKNINIMNKCKLICNDQGKKQQNMEPKDFSWDIELPLISGSIQDVIQGISDDSGFQEMIYMIL